MTERPALAGVVPYVAMWSGEHTIPTPVIHRETGRGIGYPDEQPGDRDKQGILWVRETSLPGQGRPRFAKIHARRQRHAMTKTLCQVCGHRADRTRDGVLWLAPEHPERPGEWPVPWETADPPVCAPCAAQAVHLCPALRRQYTALRVTRWRPVAVKGTLFMPWHLAPMRLGPASVYLDDYRAPWLQAGQLIVELQQFTVTTLDT